MHIIKNQGIQLLYLLLYMYLKLLDLHSYFRAVR